MTQADVYKILKRNPDKWFTPIQLSKILKVDRGSINCNLRKLWCQGLIRKKEDPNNFYHQQIFKFIK
jgi:DNA-binding MarR family transcriptional regulator